MPEQLSLNYKELLPTETAGRTFLRENYTVSTRVAYKIPFEDLKVREGFNKRIVYEGIDELAQSIKENGLTDPLTVDVMLDGTVYIEKGHRRFKALQLLVGNGEMIDFVECFPNPKSVTEFERMLNQYTSNNFQQKLKPIEAANVAFALKNNFGDISNEKIAERMGVSRQTVDNLLILANASDSIKNQIIIGEMNVKDALALIGNEKKLKKQAEKDEIKANQSSMYVQPDPVDINKKELDELKDLEKQPIPGDEELDGVDNDEIDDVRMTGFVEHQKGENGKPLELVGNLAGEKNNDKKESTEKELYDESRPELAWCQNIVKLLDKVENIADKLPDPQATKDINDRIGWMRKDMLELREWVKSNKKQNKRDR